MNANSVKSQVENLIRSANGKQDPEKLHEAQDRVYRRVLRAVAHGHPDAVEMARQALRIEDVEFPRWYA